MTDTPCHRRANRTRVRARDEERNSAVALKELQDFRGCDPGTAMPVVLLGEDALPPR